MALAYNGSYRLLVMAPVLYRKDCKDNDGNRIEQVLSAFVVLFLNSYFWCWKILHKLNPTSWKLPTPLPPHQSNGPSLSKTGKTLFTANKKIQTNHRCIFRTCHQLPGGGGGYSQKNWVGVCGPLPKTHTLFMTKIGDIPYPIYDLTLKSKPCFWPAL